MPQTASKPIEVFDQAYRDTLTDVAEVLEQAEAAPPWPMRDPGDEPPVTTATMELEAAFQAFVRSPTAATASAVSRAVQGLYDAIEEHGE